MSEDRPKGLTEEHLVYLDELVDELVESGMTNMFGAVPYLAREFGLEEETARRYLGYYWIRTFNDRHPRGA